MSLTDIIGKIKDDAAAAADQIRAEAERRTEETIAEAERQAREANQARIEQAKDRAETVRVRTLALARLAARDAMLECKQSAVDRVFATVEHTLTEMEPDAYAKLLAKMLVDNAEGDVTVEPAKADAKVVDVSLLQRAGGPLGSKATLSLGEPTDEIARGFLLRADRVVTDCSIASLVAGARERYETEVLGSLFAEEATE